MSGGRRRVRDAAGRPRGGPNGAHVHAEAGRLAGALRPSAVRTLCSEVKHRQREQRPRGCPQGRAEGGSRRRLPDGDGGWGAHGDPG